MQRQVSELILWSIPIMLWKLNDRKIFYRNVMEDLSKYWDSDEN